ncbi:MULTISPECIES: excalibur calcium-binding domain-containing protein [unclassified Thermoactinomyces]|uniref:excalibur calcium-binding domain-containing protein n=1 Tax=unclassified Thermoactinomyces TaxID=2634588 RepID=UPI0018DB7160|nr:MULTISPECIES: excalibur calcium-binding domain-containing protein [unclassified Thermoactinomyces]MBH8598728.1 excalibur calcium-binding domain-containing protein [Thermoactinomyces sp. CICC 10523]MBH8605521.1 excalibur calcium-binding domain-containing protein [Thermoactinomyces sp. CICC 10522]
MFLVIFLLCLLLLFAIVGIVYPTRLHKKIAYKKFSLGKRLWNVALVFLCFILIAILSPTQTKADQDPAKAQIEAELESTKQQLKKTNEQLKQQQQQISALQKNKQDLEAKLKSCEEEKKKLQAEITQKENEAKASEEKKQQTSLHSSSASDNHPTATKKSSSSVYYPNCSAARAAGAAPIYEGEPGYAKKLDRDGDGIACE